MYSDTLYYYPNYLHFSTTFMGVVSFPAQVMLGLDVQLDWPPAGQCVLYPNLALTLAM